MARLGRSYPVKPHIGRFVIPAGGPVDDDAAITTTVSLTTTQAVSAASTVTTTASMPTSQAVAAASTTSTASSLSTAQAVASAAAITVTSSEVYRETVLASSPVGYWRLGDPVGSVVDSSGNGHHGTYLGSEIYEQPGALGTTNDEAVRFLSEGGVSVPDYAPLDLTGDFTLELWHNASATGLLSKGGSATNTRLFWWQFGPFGTSLGQYSDGSYQTVSATNASINGVWNHLVVTKSGTTITHYLNGASNGSGTITGSPAANGFDFVIGYHAGDDFNSPGRFDEVAVYGTALSSGVIADHYAKGLTMSEAVATAATATGTAGMVAGSGTSDAIITVTASLATTQAVAAASALTTTAASSTTQGVRAAATSSVVAASPTGVAVAASSTISTASTSGSTQQGVAVNPAITVTAGMVNTVAQSYSATVEVVASMVTGVAVSAGATASAVTEMFSVSAIPVGVLLVPVSGLIRASKLVAARGRAVLSKRPTIRRV